PPSHLHSVDLSAAASPAETPTPYYRAMVEALDTELGRLLDGLGPALQSRTTVVFLGDNGTPGEVSSRPFAKDHAKGTLYEGGVNVPLIVTGPRVKVPGTESIALVSVTDLFATVAEIAKVDLGQTLPGVPLDSRSLVPYLADPSAPPQRKVLFTELFHPNGQPASVPALGGDKPVDWTCQPDLGLGTPAGPSLTICGPALFGGQESTLQLTGALPGVPALIFTSGIYAPLPAAGGALVPSLVDQVFLVSTDTAGEHSVGVLGGKGEATIYYQMVVANPGQMPPFTLSNALAVAMHGTDSKAIRNQRYKLILNAHTGTRELYDLTHDPFERVDLLQDGPLAPGAKKNLQALESELMVMLWMNGRPTAKVSSAGDP
ncbi:MAG: sulfatase-like hydrolase/transferase, partial [Planctomycetota bacterium]